MDGRDKSLRELEIACAAIRGGAVQGGINLMTVGSPGHQLRPGSRSGLWSQLPNALTVKQNAALT